jgi:uncharacterized protein (TIGR02217 family)
VSAFHEVLMPLPFALGASGGPERRVDIVTLGSGAEARNTPWAHGRRRYDIGGAVRTLDHVHELIAFFEARRGKLHGFRFRDPFDCKSCPPSASPAATDQTIGEGDGETVSFALCKAYEDAASAYARPIAKPVAASVSIAIDGVLQSPAEYDVASESGSITFVTPPTAGAIITAGFLFDTPVRFDVDRLELALDGFGAGHAVSVPLVEIRA